ncbi:protein KRTCAP2 homolog isoform X2 [Periplaneta americana]|uniref:protein KRTCAP2 homolog isoform X1 n=1 Tax=Periplaneta americana TaxID=6978 RepID=UPI0037E7AA21
MIFSVSAVSSGTSFVLSSVLTVLLFSGMQMYRQWLASSQLHTILGGYLGSVLFILVLTAVGNLESTLFGKGFQTKLFPEIFSCLIVALTASGMVHRVCTTTCFLFSMVGLYYVNRISQQTHAAPVPPQPVPTKKKK